MQLFYFAFMLCPFFEVLYCLNFRAVKLMHFKFMVWHVKSVLLIKRKHSANGKTDLFHWLSEQVTLLFVGDISFSGPVKYYVEHNYHSYN